MISSSPRPDGSSVWITLEHRRVVEVDAGHGELARRGDRLLDDPRDAAVAVELGNAEVTQVLDLRLPREHDARAELLAGEVVRRGLDRPLEDVVGEHDADLVAADEALGEPERLGDAAGPLLVAVRQQVDAELVPVAEQAKELAGVRPAGDDHQLGDAGADERLDREADHRPVVDREQMLVRDLRQRMKAAARAAGENDALHARDSTNARGAASRTPPSCGDQMRTSEPAGTVTVREKKPSAFVRCVEPSQRQAPRVRTWSRYGRAPLPGRTCPQSTTRRAGARHLRERKAERVRGRLGGPAHVEEPALEARDVRLVADEELDEQRHVRRLVRAQRRLRRRRPPGPRAHAEHPVGRIRLVAVLGQPDLLAAEVLAHLGEQRGRDSPSRSRRTCEHAPFDGDSMLGRVGYGLCAYASSFACAAFIPRTQASGPTPPVLPRGAVTPPATSARRFARWIDAYAGLSSRVHVQARRRRRQRQPLVRLVPDRPPAHERVALRRRVGEVRERRRAVGTTFGLRPPFAHSGVPKSVTTGWMPRACRPWRTASTPPHS